MSEEHASNEVRDMVREIRAAVIPMLDNVHKDVHGIRRDFRRAVAESQTALMNRLSLLEAKIDAIVPAPGAEPVNTDALDAALPAGEAATQALDDTVKQNQP